MVIAIVALGNIAMSLYFLRELFRVPANGSLESVFAQRHPGSILLPAGLAALGIMIYVLA